MTRPYDHIEAERTFYYLIGRCITRWSQVEDKLFEICKHALQSNDKQAAIVYFRTPTINSRLDLITELIRSILPKKIRSGDHEHPLIKKWTKIVADIQRLLQVRNALAHSPPQVIVSAHGISGKPKKPLPPVPPPHGKVKTSANEKLRGRDEFEVTSAELPSHYDAVVALTGRLEIFFEELKAQSLEVVDPASDKDPE